MSTSDRRLVFLDVVRPHKQQMLRCGAGFTLVELLVSLTVSLLLLGGVVSLFGSLGESVNESRSDAEMLQTLRHASYQLQSDLEGLTLAPDPSKASTTEPGFFEYVEGPHRDADNWDPDSYVPGYQPDTGLGGDDDDVLHFTTMSADGASEVVWFLTPDPNFFDADATDGPWTRTNQNSSDNTVSEKRYRLHRYALKIEPTATTDALGVSMGHVNAKPENALPDYETTRKANTLEMLTVRYNRWAHQYGEINQFKPVTAKDYKDQLEEVFESGGHETIILENVLAFDVRAWDSSAPIYEMTVKQGSPELPDPDNSNPGTDPNDPNGTIIDDGDGGFSQNGFDYLAAPGIVGYQTDWHRVQSGNTGEAIWTFTGLDDTSQYKVSATWTKKDNRANDAVYMIGWGDFGGDAGGPSLPDPVIIDDGDSSFSESGFDYFENPGLAGYQTDWHRKKAGEGAGEASWTFSSLQSGTYNVYATWREKDNRANDAPYTLEYDGYSESASVDQTAVPNGDHTEGGRKFQNLWTVEVTGGTLTVKLNESATGSGQVVADAIRVECTALTDNGGGGGGGGAETGAVLATKTINQRNEPDADFTAGGRPFEELATVSPVNGEITIKLPESAGSTGQVVADAARIECVDCTTGEETSEPPAYTQDPDAPEETVAIVPGDAGYDASVGTAQVGRGAFVDLNYLEEGPTDGPTSVYSGSGTTRIEGDPTAVLVDNASRVATYDSWSGQYSNGGIVGFDNDGDDIIDTAEDVRRHTPFKVPLRGIQIEIRVYEPESKSVRTVKVQKSLSQ